MTMPSEPQNALVATIFAGESKMAALMRSHDWSQTPLGPVETWSPSLRTTIRIILSSRYPMFVWWGSEFINLYNDAYIPILGQRHPYALGQSAREIWADLWEVIGLQAEPVLQEGNSSWNKELLMMMERNGYVEETYFTFSYSPISEDNGAISGVFCTVTEETERVLSDRRIQTLRQLTTETAEARTIEETCRICTQVLGDNPYDIPFALIYRWDRNQSLQLISTTDLTSVKIATPVASTVENFLATIAPQHLHQWLLRQDLILDKQVIIPNLIEQFGAFPKGAWLQPPDQAVILPLSRVGQKAFGFLLLGVSPHRKLDEAYQGFFDLVAVQITAAISNAQTHEEERQRSETLTELDQVKTVFFNNISHELRTPLTLILSPAEDGLADVDDPLPPIQRERLELVHRNGLRLLKLVNTLLDFSRLESDRVQAVYEPIDLAAFTTELASVFRSAMTQANLRFVVDCPPLPQLIYVDREMWEKIVLNLLSNAFKFTFSGEVTVRLRPKGEQVEFSVEDTGIGIPAAELPHLFQRFHRVKETKGRTFEGSGIGLSLVQELVRLHGGTIQVNSVEGQGSCFQVLIPAGAGHLPPAQIGAARPLTSTATAAVSYLEEALRWLPPESPASLEPQPESPTAPPHPASHTAYTALPVPAPLDRSTSAKVLLVDDNADMRDYLKRLLSQYWQVETAADGAIALDLIQQQPPDLVLSDVMMPVLDGFQLLKALRSDPQTSSIPIILLSARAGEESTIEGLAAGADDYLIKPFSARELIARVRTQLQMSRLRQEQATNRFKDEFLKTITHELQAPLVTVVGWARLLQTKTFDAATRARALSSIERNAEFQAKLVKDLLDVSSILSGNLRLKPQLVELNALVQDAIISKYGAAEAKAIDLELAIANIAEQTILADGDRLRQVIMNLLDNAIKFTPEGGQVDIHLGQSDSEIQIVVKDNGIGISPEFLPTVFDRFTQAEVPSRHAPGGVGIGLAITRYLVELHHGTIEAASEGVGQGATFTVRLPLRTTNRLNLEASES